MEHLTIDEIVDFVSATEINKETLDLASTVTEHICKCNDCFKLVKAMQIIHDEFMRLRTEKNFRDYANVIMSKNKKSNNDRDFEIENNEMCL